MCIRTEKKGDFFVIRVEGNFTKETTPELQRICKKTTEDSSVKGIVLDYKKVKKIDSSAFACMIDFMVKHKGEKSLFAVNVSRLGKRYIEILNIKKAIKTIKESELW